MLHHPSTRRGNLPEGGRTAPMIGINRVVRDTRLPAVLEALGAGGGLGEAGEKYGQMMVSASGYSFLNVVEGLTSLYVVRPPP
eukprot:125322-Prorocentrum_minimum.AAC.1